MRNPGEGGAHTPDHVSTGIFAKTTHMKNKHFCPKQVAYPLFAPLNAAAK